MTYPKMIFIVPYRNREEQQHFFLHYMKYILEDINDEDYKIWFIHQCDERIFNRGAMKNIGFLAAKDMYPHDYLKISYVFHDVDVVPYKKNMLTYQTIPGVVKHFYGFEYALGGIVSILGIDFERVNGFPSYWGWALEDNCLQKRCLQRYLKLDRDVFYKIGDHHILHLFDELKKPYCNSNTRRYIDDNGEDGISSITSLHYINEHCMSAQNTTYTMIHVHAFEPYISYKNERFTERRITDGNVLNVAKPIHKMKDTTPNVDATQSTKPISRRVYSKTNKRSLTFL